MPTTLTAVVTLELLTDGFPGETSWLLIDNDKDGVIVQSGPGDGETYDGDSLYSFTWTLDRCTSYTFTIYGAYGYQNLDGTGTAVVMMQSSYQLRNIEVREVLPNGQPLDNAFHGPPVNSMYPLGSFLEDYEYIENSGTLDEHNGRYCVES